MLENLEMGAWTAAGRREWDANLSYILTLFPVLEQRSRQLAGTLSGGEQQMVAIGRGLASSPRLLMLDEPSMGLAPTIVDTIFERIIEIRRDKKLTVLLVEQRAVGGAAIVRSGLCAGDRARRARGHARGTAVQRPHPQSLSRHVTRLESFEEQAKEKSCCSKEETT